MDIAYCFDFKYRDFAYVSFCSLLRAHRPGSLRVFCVVPEEFEDCFLIPFRLLGGQYGAEVVFRKVRPSENPFRSFVHGRWSPVIFYRLFLNRLLPGLERILYLDADTLVLRDLSGLCGMDMEGRAIAAVRDIGMFFDRHVMDIVARGLVPLGGYVNSGILLMDLERMEGLVRSMLSVRGECVCPDQDVLNFALAGRVMFLPMKYNYQPGLYRKVRYWNRSANIFALDMRELAEAELRPVVVHFFSDSFSKKPHAGCCSLEHYRWILLARALGVSDAISSVPLSVRLDFLIRAKMERAGLRLRRMLGRKD